MNFDFIKLFKCLSDSSVSRNALISSCNKTRWYEPTEKPSDVDEDEDKLIELELLDLEKPDEQPTKVSDDESESNPPQKNKSKTQSNINNSFFLS